MKSDKKIKNFTLSYKRESSTFIKTTTERKRNDKDGINPHAARYDRLA